MCAHAISSAVFCLMVFVCHPVCVQALMFWVVDNFLMKKGRTKAKLEEREVGDDSRGSSKVRYRRALSHDDSESEVSLGRVGGSQLFCYSLRGP